MKKQAFVFVSGLETFISTAKSLPSAEQYDVVEGYIKISMECAEILKLLDGERRPENEMLLIFQALENILLRTASDLSHFRVVGMTIVKKLINSYMRLIYAALYSESHRMARLCLTLLSAMVAQGPDAARDIYSHFDFNNKSLSSLVKRRDYKGKPDVRMAYIQYALSFLIAGDNTILTHILELKDFIPDILRTGLKEDRISTISLLLSTLATKVVHNKNISKTQKVRFFTAELLNHIASLYRWNGIPDVSAEDSVLSGDPEEAGKALVRELVHKFLMDLCCSLKHGINFYDPTLGTSGRGGNLVLLRFLLSLKTAVEDEMVAELVVNIFKVCPDLLNRYFKESQYSFVPRLKSAWLDNMKLLRKIYEAQPEVSSAFKTTEFVPLPRLLSMVLVTTIPAVCNKAMFTQGLNIASKTVKHTIFSLISTILKRALKNIEYCLTEKIWEKSEIYTPSVMQEFVQQYREALSKRVNINHSQFKKSTKKLIIKVLHDSGVFDYTWKELELWLEHLDNTVEVKKEAVIQFLERILVKLVTNPYPYTDKAADIVQEASVLQANLFKQDIDNISLPISHIDDVLDMIDVLVEGSEGLNEEIGFTLNEDMIVSTFPFSAVVPASLEARNKLLLEADENARGESIVEYLIAIYTDLLHSQRDPLALCLMFQQYDKELPSVCPQLYLFRHYYSLWIPQQAKETLVSDTENGIYPSFSTLLKNTYQKGVVGLLEVTMKEKLNEAILQLQPQQLLLASKHVLLYLKTTVENFSNVRTFVLSPVPFPKQSLPFVIPILEELFSLVFKHPTLENWFLAVEQRSLPPHNLSPVKVKLLSIHLNHGILELLKMSCPLLQPKNQLEVFSKYFETITKTVLEELHPSRQEGCKVSSKRSQQMEALQELYTYLDAQQLKEVTLALLQLPRANLTMKESETDSGKKICLSTYGETLMQLLTESYQKGSLKGDLFFSREHIQGMGILLSTAATKELERVFMHVIQKEPVFAQAVGVDVQLFCLQHSTETSLSIVALLIRYCRTHLLQFELWCLNHGTGKLLKKNVSLFLPLINTYLDCQKQHTFAQGKSAVTSTLRDALWSELLDIALNRVERSAQMALICFFPIPCSWEVADAVSRAFGSSAEKLQAWKKCLLAACIKWLILTYSSSKEQEACLETERTMLSRLEKLASSVTEVVPEDWHSFVKMGLKYRYKDQDFLKTLNAVINMLYRKEVSLSQRLVKLSVLYMMITQHSLFLSTMLKSIACWPTTDAGVEALVDVLLTLVKGCPAVCESNHFAVLLGAYGATLSVSDQKILLLLKLYEKNGLSLVNFRILLWGPAAVEHHKTCKSLGKSLWQQPSMEEILCLLDQEMMERTILHFPQHRHLLSTEQMLLSKGKSEVALKDLYDPCFLLQLFSELLRPECVAACRKFVEVNALGLVVAALSSYDCNMRAAAYHVLSSFRPHLEGARFREQKQLLYLMDVVQNGIRQPNLRLTFPWVLYISRVAQQMLKPEEHMYTKLNRFLLSHQYLDLKKVPGFFHLFYSFDSEHKFEREWSLTIIGEGLRDKHCYELYDYQRIFHIILSFFHNPLCDEATQDQILEILQNAAFITKAAYELIRDHSLLTWILSILEKRVLENKMLNHVISLVHTLWLTNLGDKQKALGISCKEELQENQKFLPLQLVSEFLHILITLLKHIRANLDPVKLIQFFSTLNSVLEYRAVVFEAFRAMNRFTVNEHILSNKDVLLLLHKWSRIGKDEELHNDLQTVAQQYKTKELLSKCSTHHWFKVDCLFLLSSNLIKKNTLGETASEWTDVYLGECRSVLRSLLVHWEPCFLNVPAEHQKEQNGYGDPRLTSEIAYLVFRWLVKSHIDNSANIQSALLTFRWFKKNVLGNSTVEEKILKDATLKSGMFKVYSSIYNASEEKTVGLSDLSLLNGIMLHLLASQNLTKNVFYMTVKKFCLSPMTEEDRTKKAAGIFLTSIYIGDIWLGAKQPDTFITHVKLICGAADRKQIGDQKKGKCEEAMISLCKDIYAFLILHPAFEY
uniref:URB1 ribosome biogenesis homolog n=1 Tax=Varanus komodoensis TaxID=61221 RepID=A0A8D2JBW5_VARKO